MDDLVLVEEPAGDGAVKGGVPCAESGLRVAVWGDVREGVVEETGAALDVCVGSGGEMEELDGVGEGGWEFKLSWGGHEGRLGRTEVLRIAQEGLYIRAQRNERK